MSDCLEPFELFLENRRRPFTKQLHHRPSSARIEIDDGEVIGTCLRNQYYSWKGVEPSNPMELKGLFATYMGSIFENGYEEGLKKQEVDYIREYPFQVDIGLKSILSGRMDFIIKGDKNIGVELKSGYGRGMDFSKKSGLPKDGYILQMMLYLKYSPISLAKISNPIYARDSFYRLSHDIVINKDNTFSVHGLKGWINIPWTCDMIIESWKKLENYLDNDELPPKDYKDNWHCAYCDYRDLCKREG